MHVKHLIAVTSLLSATVFPAWLATAGTNDSKHHQQHGAHAHGVSELTLALEGNNLEASFLSPAANIVGFEHKASTPQQTQSVENANALLKSPQKIFLFSGTSCEPTLANVDLSAVMKADNDDHHHNDHHHNDHHHDEHEGDDHADEEESHDHQDTHSEISVHYQFRCQQGIKLTSVTLNFLEHFSGINKLKVMWVTDTRQGSVELKNNSKTVYLR